LEPRNNTSALSDKMDIALAIIAGRGQLPNPHLNYL